MYPTSSVVATITTDRIREAEAARRANRNAEPAEPRRWRRRARPLRSLAMHIASPRVRF